MPGTLLFVAGWALEVNAFGVLEIRHLGALVASAAEPLGEGALLRYTGAYDGQRARWRVWLVSASSAPLVAYEGSGAQGQALPVTALSVQGVLVVRGLSGVG
jgi:hypothetical protein